VILAWVGLWLQDPAAPVLVPAGSHPWIVSSAAMEPTLVEGDVVLSDRPQGECGTTAPVAGDVVLVRSGDAMRVRRVIAGPGRTVQMIDGRVVIDGEGVPREEVSRQYAYFTALTIYRETLPGGPRYLTQDFGPSGPLDDTPPISVGPGLWFTMGDSRDNAIDSRVEGPTPAADLCGVIVRVLESTDPARVGRRP